jgi:hypothetical protein
MNDDRQRMWPFLRRQSQIHKLILIPAVRHPRIRLWRRHTQNVIPQCHAATASSRKDYTGRKSNLNAMGALLY